MLSREILIGSRVVEWWTLLASSAGKEFTVTPKEQLDALEPLDLDLLEKLRKKYNL